MFYTKVINHGTAYIILQVLFLFPGVTEETCLDRSMQCIVSQLQKLWMQ